MSHLLKEKILAILQLYLSKESPAFHELMQQVEKIPDEQFTERLNTESSSIIHRVVFLLDEIIYFVNEHYQINRQQGQELDRIINEIKSMSIDTLFLNQTMIKRIASLESRIEQLEKEKDERKKCRITAEILTPIVRLIRAAMINRRIPDVYYSKIVINALLSRVQGKNISWEISDFNDNYSEIQFDLNIFDQLELIIKNITNMLKLDYETLLELLYIKLDRNEIEHDSVKQFFRYNSNGNLSFNCYLNSMGSIDVFTINEKLCLEILYRNHFIDRYSAMQ